MNLKCLLISGAKYLYYFILIYNCMNVLNECVLNL